ncbi:hypothetical protein B296_00054202 [Ensete ventricosum]|uniref:Uncharacterized protein n=1 Tax=Ensete ventricosum TaxID=4639 RepID=A0A426WZB0_ENSVE|nr:hypothetical protein B296_00054202 [Ensete ventricosum]
MLRPDVTQEWVDKGELPRERTKNQRWRRPYDMLAEATHGEVVVRVHHTRICMTGAIGEVDYFSAHIRLRELDKSEDNEQLLGGHSGVEAGGRKGQGSDDESSWAQLPKSKASVRKEVDSKVHHSAIEADLPIAKEGIKMQGNR